MGHSRAVITAFARRRALAAPLLVTLVACSQSAGPAQPPPSGERPADPVPAPTPVASKAPGVDAAPAAPAKGGSMESPAQVPVLEGVPLAGPPGLRVMALDCDGSTIYAAGTPPSSKAPLLWVGELDPGGARLAWTTKIAVPSSIEPDYLVLSADRDSRGTRVAISGNDEFSQCDGVRVFERSSGGWAQQGAMEHPGGERDILFGVPLLARGTDLFTFEVPGSPITSAVIHRYRREGSAWSRSVVPFAPGAAELWWQLALSPGGDVLSVTTEHQGGRYHVDLYSRGATGEVGHLRSVELPVQPAQLAAMQDRIAVGLSRPAPDGSNVVVIAREGADWRVRASVTLPPGAPPSVLAMAAVANRVAVLRGQLWLVDAVAGRVTHRLTAPEPDAGRAPTSPLASCGGALLASSGDALVLFDLTRVSP